MENGNDKLPPGGPLRKLAPSEALSGDTPLPGDILDWKQLESGLSGASAIEMLRKVIDNKSSKDLPQLIEYLNNCRDVIQISFLTKHLGLAFASSDLLPVLMPFLKHEDDRIVANTIEGIEAIGTPTTFAVLAQILNHRSHRVRGNAAKALARHDPQIAHKIIHEMLRMRDRPHIIAAACHAIKEIRAKEFLPQLIPLVSDPVLGQDALNAFGVIGADAAVGFLEQFSEPGADPVTRDQILYAVELHIGKRRSAQTNPWARPGPTSHDRHTLEFGEQKIFALEPNISREEAESKAVAAKIDAFGLLSKLLYRPKMERITLVYAETRFEPFWHVICQTSLDYTRVRSEELRFDSHIQEVRIGERIFPIQNGHLQLSIPEHCIDEVRREVYIDAQTGAKGDFAKHAAANCREIKQTEELMIEDLIVVPAQIKASLIVRDLLADMFKPIKATEINAERIILSKLSLCFRPVYAFEFRWEDYQQIAVLEIDGITGALVAGKAVKQKLKEIFNEENLFEIGGEAIGMVVPGGNLAMKLAKAMFNSG
ncbi:MAG: HEAT repeat domain-containing protein [Candidatus Riflebacteria bacterium]|nr:HEAT repeat domain-containing protein [Candidatus Riflebacteria bacterium]